MKRLMLFFAALVMCGAMYAQGVFTMVNADAYDGFVNIRQTPSSKGKVIGRMNNYLSHGIYEGVKLGQQGGWTKVKSGGVVGWCYSKYVQEINWYDGSGRYIIVAAKSSTPIFQESGEGTPGFVHSVKKGTIIADYDDLSENLTEDGYYILMTAHYHYLVRKSDVIVKRRY